MLTVKTNLTNYKSLQIS